MAEGCQYPPRKAPRYPLLTLLLDPLISQGPFYPAATALFIY